MAIDAQRAPAGGLEAHDLVVGDGERGGAVDGDLVVVEQHDQLVEPEVSGERDRLVADALHQAAVADDRIGVVVDDIVAQAGIEQALGQRHADGVGEALAQGAGGGLDARRVAEFRMAGGHGAELPEVAQLLHGHAGIPGEMEERVQQHRAVAGGQHEAVAVGPVRRRGVELQELGEQNRRHVGHAHGHAGVPAFGPLHGVHGQRADGVGHVPVQLVALGLVLHRLSAFLR